MWLLPNIFLKNNEPKHRISHTNVLCSTEWTTDRLIITAIFPTGHFTQYQFGILDK